MHALNPSFYVLSRKNIGRGLDDTYVEAKAKIALLPYLVQGDVALTCDGWSFRIMNGYFVVTLHWVDKNWNLSSTDIEFTYFPPPHNHWTTAELLFSILKDLNLTTCVRSITTDSGAEMPPEMRHVYGKLNEEFNAKLKSD